MNTQTKILIVGPSWAGDMVMAQSLFMALKNKQPECRIDVMAPSWTFSLLERMPEVSSSIEMPLGHGKFGLTERIKLGKQLRTQQYDQAILLPNSWKSALIPFFARIPLRTGYIGECRWGLVNDSRRLDKQALPMTAQRFVALAHPEQPETAPDIPVPSFTIDAENIDNITKKFKLGPAEKILALCPGAEYGTAKRWPAKYYAEIAKKKHKKGWDVWLFGSEKDKPVTTEINRESGDICMDFSGMTSLAEAVDLMSLVDTVITNDSGLMHVAAALNKKMVAIYGSSDPGFTPPLNDKARIASLNLKCSPCFKRHCPLGHTNCLNHLYPEQILLEMNRL